MASPELLIIQPVDPQRFCDVCDQPCLPSSFAMYEMMDDALPGLHIACE
jgi:hypothetical protein